MDIDKMATLTQRETALPHLHLLAQQGICSTVSSQILEADSKRSTYYASGKSKNNGRKSQFMGDEDYYPPQTKRIDTLKKNEFNPGTFLPPDIQQEDIDTSNITSVFQFNDNSTLNAKTSSEAQKILARSKAPFLS
jgi:hypothetical protein